MSDCRVVNSRLSNGRTVLRAFGGDGIDPVVTTDNPVDAEREKIEVEVESCILANAREFLLKLGTNRKIRGEFVSTTTGNGYDTERMEPSLTLDGRSYSPSQDNLSDEEFVRNFVLTELTLENSALYNSGLFAIGFESSFAGPMLDGGMMPLDFWTDVGGTSYPALLRMVGEVRIYDWKPLSAVDSSTLIELPHGVGGNTAFLQLNIDDMLNKVRDYGGEEFADIISLNRYYGWYVMGGAGIVDAEAAFRKEMDGWNQVRGDRPVIFTEYGADTLASEHKLPSVMWSQEYQNEYLEMNHRVFDSYDFVQGELMWNFADFQTTEGILRVNGNKKGAFTRQRQPKDVAYVLKSRWEALPTDYKSDK